MNSPWKVAALTLVLAGCASSDDAAQQQAAAAQCNTAPSTCAAGTTCWIADDAGTFACLPSGAGQSGDTCTNYIDKATCGDGLACLATGDPTKGVCSPTCTRSQDCAGDALCQTVTYPGGGAFGVCASPLRADAGSDAAASDAGADAASADAEPDADTDATTADAEADAATE